MKIIEIWHTKVGFCANKNVPSPKGRSYNIKKKSERINKHRSKSCLLENILESYKGRWYSAKIIITLTQMVLALVQKNNQVQLE